MEMADLGNSDRFAPTLRVVKQDDMPAFIEEQRSIGVETILDQDIIDQDDGG
jgi:hypothetical protein